MFVAGTLDDDQEMIENIATVMQGAQVGIRGAGTSGQEGELALSLTLSGRGQPDPEPDSDRDPELREPV